MPAYYTPCHKLSGFFQQFFSISSGRFQDSTRLETLCLSLRNIGIVGSKRSMHGPKASQRVDPQEEMYDTPLPAARHFLNPPPPAAWRL
jgi:hypothetical protein